MIETDGKILVGGTDFIGSYDFQPFVAQFNADGSVDTTFNAGAPLKIPGSPLSGLAVEPNGLIVVTMNSATNESPSPQYNNAVEIYESNGSFDPAFVPQLSVEAAEWNAMAVDSAGNILLTGGGPNLEVARLLAPAAASPGTTITPPPPWPGAVNTLHLSAPAGSELALQLGDPTDFSVTLNGATTVYSLLQYNALDVIGAAASTVVVAGNLGTTSLGLTPGFTYVYTTNLTVSVNAPNIYVYGSIQDTAQLWGAPGVVNTLVDASNYAAMEGSGYSIFAVGFGTTYGYASSPQDTAYTYAGPGDTFVATPTFDYLSSGGYYNEASGFASTLGVASANGSGQAWFYGSTNGTNSFVANQQYSYMSGAGFFNEVTGFNSVMGVSGNANDYAYLTDTTGDASFTGQSSYSLLVGANFTYQAIGFANIVATGTTSDQAAVYDSNPNDAIQQNGDQVTLSKTAGSTVLYSFGEVAGHVATSDDPNHVVDYYYFYHGLGS